MRRHYDSSFSSMDILEAICAGDAPPNGGPRPTESDTLGLAKPRASTLEEGIARLCEGWRKRDRPYGDGEFIRAECADELEALVLATKGAADE